MTLFSALTGPPRFDARTSWRWWTAALMCLATMLLSMVSLGLVTLAGLFALIMQSSQALGDIRAFVKTLSTVQWAVILSIAGIVAQGIGVWVIWRAGARGSESGAVRALSLAPAPIGVFGHVIVALAVVVGVGVLAAAITLAFPHKGSVQPVLEFIKSDYWWIAIAPVAVGAPLFEEIVFRGFLFTAIAGSKLGAAGAILITSVVWALFHAGYVWQEMVIITAFGFVLGWLVWQLGSVWPGIVCHAVWNFGVLAGARAF